LNLLAGVPMLGEGVGGREVRKDFSPFFERQRFKKRRLILFGPRSSLREVGRPDALLWGRKGFGRKLDENDALDRLGGLLELAEKRRDEQTGEKKGYEYGSHGKPRSGLEKSERTRDAGRLSLTGRAYRILAGK
jgi:hypothetical protein